MRVLVAEDEKDLADAIAVGLRREGYAVDVAYDGDDAFVKARVYPYDLVCLDLNMPGLDGRDVCRRLRDDREAPDPRILMLTARARRRRRPDRRPRRRRGRLPRQAVPLRGAEGANRALLRREPVGSSTVLRLGGLELDVARHEARRDGQPLGLSPKQLALLRYFMSHPGQVLSEGRFSRTSGTRTPTRRRGPSASPS